MQTNCPYSSGTTRDNLVRLDFLIFQFGPLSKGGGYLRKLLARFIESESDIEDVNCDLMLQELCEKEHIKLASIQRSIQRFVDNGWEQGCRSRWREFTGWAEQNPPDMKTAIQLVFHAYVELQKKASGCSR